MDLHQQLSQSSKVDNLNKIINERIGYGFAQQKLTRALYLLLFSEGCETIVLGLLLPIIRLQWGLTIFQQSLLITVVYMGVAIGSYIEVYADKYGRYKFVTWDAAITTAFGLLSCVCWNYNSFLVARFFYGIGIGICLPLSASYIIQNSPAYMRATLMSKSRVYWSGGCLTTAFLCWFCLYNNHWRLVLFIICIPSIYALYEHYFYGRQSLRYLWVQKRTQEAFQMANYMCVLNGKQKIPLRQFEIMMRQQEEQTHKNQFDMPLSQMFNQKYAKSSFRLISSWFSACFIYYGIMLLMPSILERVFLKNKGNHNFKYIFIIIISCFEVLAFLFSSKVMDHPLIGRKKSVYYSFFIIFGVTTMVLIFGQDNVIFLFVIFALIKIVVTSCFMTLYSYTSQIYETMIRGKALGICSMSGRIASMFLGVVGVPAMNYFDGNGLYLIFMGLAIFSGYGSYTMPYCTNNRSIE